MNIEDIKNMAVIGAGNMGHQISMLCAIHGYKTVCTDIDTEILKKAEAFKETGDTRNLPSPSVVEKYIKGEYGQKTGKGWYDYS